MKSGRDAGALREALQKRGFTPAAREVDAIVDLLDDADEEIAREAERSLARLGAAVLPRVGQRVDDPRAAVRAGLYRVVGRIAPEGEAEAGWLIAGLLDADPRAKRHAANALGKLRQSTAAPAIEEALLAAWDRGPSPDLERAIAASLGKLGSERALSRLSAGSKGDPSTSRVAQRAALTIARDAARKTPSGIDAERASTEPVWVALRCRSGLERVVADEAREHLAHAEPASPGDERVLARWQGKLSDLFRVRTATSFGFALTPVAISATPEEALVAALASDEARRVLETWTVGVVRYRIEWVGAGHRRGATWRTAQAVAAVRPSWINDPTECTWEVVAREKSDKLYVELSPRGLADPRFAYRVRDVPAASHPPLAAALVRTAGLRADDVVWDPFMGSGVELVERALAGKYRRLEGSDTDPRALAAARANLAAAGVKGVSLSLADATSHAPPGVTLILTNPPMGRRLARDGSLASLMDKFVDHAADVLRPGGRLVWLSPLGVRPATRARGSNRGSSGPSGTQAFRVDLDEEVDMGGFHAHLERLIRH